MKISYSTTPANTNVNTGYGYAGFNMVLTLQSLGHKVTFKDATAPVQVFFGQPPEYQFYDGQYKIGYTPWESTELPEAENWTFYMNQCDEIWTPSQLIAKWYKDAGVTPPIYVYEHGVSSAWRAVRRTPQNVINFLHVGEPAPRKGGDIALKAFKLAFPNRDDVHLTIKAHHLSYLEVDPDDKQVTVLTYPIPEHDLINLHHQSDVLVYPSYGEGFGMIPLQAIATGMPTICTEAWAPYKRFILPELRLSSKLDLSPWPDIHPGKMFHPDVDHLVEIYRDAADNFAKYANDAYGQAELVHIDYDWKCLTERAFKPISRRFDV